MNTVGDSFRCPGLFHCKSANFCLPLENLCDGTRHCPLGDDEESCDETCPKECSCVAQIVSCTDAGLRVAPQVQKSARLLDLHSNIISTLTNSSFHSLSYLVELHLSHNSLMELRKAYFEDLINLRVLNLSSNFIEIVGRESFVGLQRLEQLVLTKNKIKVIEADAFVDLVSVTELDLSSMHIDVVRSFLFSPMRSLRKLDVSSNEIVTLESDFLGGLESIEYLFLQDNQIIDFDSSNFASLSDLVLLHTDDFLFCCLANLDEENCLPLPDELSSCEDLMKQDILRAFLWIFGVMAIVGNLFSIVYHIKVEKPTVNSELTKHLACADCLFGVYMICIAAVDLYYRGVYIEHAQAWKKSAFCTVSLLDVITWMCICDECSSSLGALLRYPVKFQFLFCSPSRAIV